MPNAANLAKLVRDSELSVRSINALSCAGIKIETVADLVVQPEEVIRRIPNIGRRSLREIKEYLTQMGLHLGMSPETIAKYSKIAVEDVGEVAKAFATLFESVGGLLSEQR